MDRAPLQRLLDRALDLGAEVWALAQDDLPALVADAGAAGRKIRYDFWLTVGELVSENYFGQIQARCRQYHVPSGGHLLAEEGIVVYNHLAIHSQQRRPPTVPVSDQQRVDLS